MIGCTKEMPHESALDPFITDTGIMHN